jgi:hypothetical protein
MFHIDVKSATLRFPYQQEPNEPKNDSSTSDDFKATSPSDQVDQDNRERRERLSNVDAKVVNGVSECSSLWRKIVSY